MLSIYRVTIARACRRLGAALCALLFLLTTQQLAARPYGPYAQTPGQAAVASMLDTIPAGRAGSRTAMLGAIDALPTAGARADALGQLSAQSYTLAPRLVIQAMDGADRAVHGYLVERRSIASDAPRAVPLTGDGTINMMLTSDLRQAKYEQRVDRPGVKSDSRSVRFGIDVTPRKGLLVGVMLGIDGLDAQLDPRRPRITIFNTHIGPYASLSNGKAYLDANLAYNYSQLKLRREISYTGFVDRLTASSSGDSWLGSAEAGLMLRYGKARIQPFAGLHYRYADIAGFSETGGPAAIEVATYRTKSLRSSLGLRASATVKSGSWAVRPTVQADWQRELRARPDSLILARFTSRDLPIFSLKPTRLARDAATVSAGVTATYNSRTSFRVAYTGEYSSDRRVNGVVFSVSRRF